MRLVIWALLVSFSVPALCSDNLIVYLREDFRPYSYIEKGGEPGDVKGFSVEQISKLLRNAKVPFRIYGVPFGRALKSTRYEPNTLVYPIVKNKERADRYVWVGPLGNFSKVNLYKLKNRNDVVITKNRTLKDYVIGVVRGFSTHKLMLSQGYLEGKNLSVVSNQKQNVDMLLEGKIDMIVGFEDSRGNFIDSQALSKKAVTKVAHVEANNKLYFAFNKQTSSKFIKSIKQELKKGDFRLEP